ncbi:hypothetical protein BD410DRAFT_831427 [Rickenella mellea]|uniref:Nephrocystin 3-like N-terminal domain-containing protein n=1 Tax=Rickenella mellea TaxID=50990 RepID=A0A4Y7PPZ5_9AGAM|nr:hypothetical protein BD410DRAFT_831427 [Rickenella mellea]
MSRGEGAWLQIFGALSLMVLRDGIYKIRNLRTRNHASLLLEQGDIVACDGYYRAGEKWQVNQVIENDRYEIRNFDKPEYYASCDHRPIPGQHVYLCGLPRRQLWTIREDVLGNSIEEDMKTYTILADESGGYWNFKTREPNAQTILTRNPPNDWSLWVFEPAEVIGPEMRGQPCRYHHTPESPTSSEGSDELDGSEYHDKIPRVEGAAYNSSQRDFRTGCLSGTRDYLLTIVHEWVQGRGSTPPLFWLNGLAGTGKTTIAHSIAEYYDERRQLGATFFFSRDQQDCRDTRQVFRTIAYQLGNAYSDVRVAIAKAIKDLNPLHSNSQTQLLNLIIEPLRSFSLPSSGPIVIILDALDESDDHTAAANIVELIATELSRAPLPLKFFVTSRPEKNLRSRFYKQTISSQTQTMILHDIDIDVVQKDIRLFLQVKLTEIAEIHREVIPQKPTWPTAPDIDALTKRAGGLFIFASTLVGFLEGSSFRAPERLWRILNAKDMAPNSNLKPYANLDKLYHQILEDMLHAGPDSVEDTATTFRRVVGTILFLQERASCGFLSSLLNTPVHTVDVNGALMHLHSVIKVPTGNNAVEIFHPSFHDYLTNPARCTDDRLFILPRLQHRIIAGACLQAMIDSLPSTLSRTIYRETPPTNFDCPQWLIYACRHWTEHARLCLPDSDVEFFALTHRFYSTTSLNWIIWQAISCHGLDKFMHFIEQAAQLGLRWRPLLSTGLEHLGNALYNRHKAYRNSNDRELYPRFITFASVLAIELKTAESRNDRIFAPTNLLTPFSMISLPEICQWDYLRIQDQKWLEDASVRAPPGSAAQSAYYHILGCLAYVKQEFQRSLKWLQMAFNGPHRRHSPEILRDMVAARCSGARDSRYFINDEWDLPAHVIDKYIQSLQGGGGCRVDNDFTLGNLYWRRFQLLGNTSNSEDIDMSIQYLQNAVNAGPQNCLQYEALLNLGHSFCMRYEFFGSHTDIDASEKCLREVEAHPHDHFWSRFYLERDLGRAMYKSFKLRGRREDIDNSISHLSKAKQIYSDELIISYLAEARSASKGI